MPQYKYFVKVRKIFQITCLLRSRHSRIFAIIWPEIELGAGAVRSP